MEHQFDLDTFSKILRDKGYDGYFHTQGAYAGKLKDSINEYLESSQNSTDNLSKNLLLTGYLQWTGDDKPRIECSMWVKYLNSKFSLNRMEIAKKDGFGQLLKKKELVNLSVISVPKLKEAVALVNDEPKQKTVKSLKRFKL